MIFAILSSPHLCPLVSCQRACFPMPANATPLDTLATWRDLALAACQMLVMTVASARGRKAGSIWDFEEAIWYAVPSTSRAVDWARDLRALSSQVLRALGGPIPCTRSPADAYLWPC